MTDDVRLYCHDCGSRGTNDNPAFWRKEFNVRLCTDCNNLRCDEIDQAEEEER